MIGIAKYLNYQDVVQILDSMGETPILLHHTDLYNEPIESMVSNIKALVIMGGEDINPLLYNQEKMERTGIPNNTRDEFELSLIRNAVKMGIKILGICRGHQLLNAAFGGTLMQDIYTYGFHTHRGHHNIELSNFGADLFNGRRLIPVNSYHHQAVKKIAPDFEIHGVSDDFIVEMIYSNKYKALGVQWHPEWLENTEEVWKWIIS